MIKTILFDYAGVLTPTKNNFIFAEKNSQKFGITTQELMSISYKNWDRALTAELSDKDFWQGLSTQLNVDPKELRDLIVETFPIDQRMVGVLDQLKSEYKLVMVSNQVEGWLEPVIDESGLRERFHLFINSYQVGLKKPDKEFFLLVLKRTNSKPEETLFIDDSSKNIERAKELGFETILFENFDQFKKELENQLKISVKD